jgi:FixJ family two-component response regulator
MVPLKPEKERGEHVTNGGVTHRESIVFVVDDDVSVRESLKELIGTQGWEIAAFSSAKEFLLYPQTAVPCCLVLDVGLPDINGLELQKRMNVHGSNIPIVFITGVGDIPMTVRAMKAGAVEFLTKPFKHEDLFGAIAQAIERSRAAITQQAEMVKLQRLYSALTPREQEVMALVVSGLLNKQVGFQLGISEITVKAHRGQVMRKMKAASFVDLVIMAGKLSSAPS